MYHCGQINTDMDLKKTVLSFVIGSSILSTVWSEWYMGKNYDSAGCPCDLEFFGNKNVKFWLYPIIVPILYGLFNVLNVFLQSQFTASLEDQSKIPAGGTRLVVAAITVPSESCKGTASCHSNYNSNRKLHRLRHHLSPYHISLFHQLQVGVAANLD